MGKVQREKEIQEWEEGASRAGRYGRVRDGYGGRWSSGLSHKEQITVARSKSGGKAHKAEGTS